MQPRTSKSIVVIKWRSSFWKAPSFLRLYRSLVCLRTLSTALMDATASLQARIPVQRPSVNAVIHDAGANAVIHGAVLRASKFYMFYSATVRAVVRFYGATGSAVIALSGAIIVGCGAYVSCFGDADGYAAIQGSTKVATASSK